MNLDPAIVGIESAHSSLYSPPHSNYTPTSSRLLHTNACNGQTSNSSALEAKQLLELHERDQAYETTLHNLDEYCEDASLFCARAVEDGRDSPRSSRQSLLRKSPACSGASVNSEISKSSTQESLHSQGVTLSHRGRCFSATIQPPNGMDSSLVPK